MMCDYCGKDLGLPAAWIIVRASAHESRMADYCARCITWIVNSAGLAKFERHSRYVDVGTDCVIVYPQETH